MENLDICELLYQYVSVLPHYNYQMLKDINFKDGIYLMFEKNEHYKNFDRIVRVGTHNKDGNLVERLKAHYLSSNKDGSIFRKNIGKAILNKRNDPYLEKWTLDSSKPEIKGCLTLNDLTIQKNIECEVSDYIQNNITFVCFEVANERDRLRLEAGIIAALNKSSFVCCADWLGLHSPEEEIRKSGLWLKQGLDAKPLTLIEFENIKNGCYSSK